MKKHAATHQMVDLCADAVAKAGGGECLPCVKYVLLTTCGLLRCAQEDVTFDRDEAGREVIPLPGLDAPAAQLALDLLHRVRDTDSLDQQETVEALRAMELLDATALAGELNARLWYWIDEGRLEDVLPHAPRLLRDPQLQGPVMRRLAGLRVLWTEFRREVLDKLAIDHALAKTLMFHLNRFYPAGEVLRAVLERLRQPTADKVLELCSRHGTYYHPCEVNDLLEHLRVTLARHKLESPAVGLADTLLRALSVYHALPLAASNVHGSLILFEHPAASVLLTVEPECKADVAVRVTSWLRLALNRDAGTLGVRFVLSRLDEYDSHAVQLRVTCTSYAPGSEPAEVWYSFCNVDRPAWTELRDAAVTFGQAAALSDALRNPWRVRLDFFYDPVASIFSNPFRN